MSPTHTKKDNRRYRYYVSQAVLQYREADAGSVLRISAKTIEDPVIKRLMQYLQSPKELFGTFSHLKLSARKQTSIIQNAKPFVKIWENLSPSRKIDYLRIIIRKIEVGCESINITLSRAGMSQCFLNENPNNEESRNNIDDELVISIPTTLKRCGHETKLIICDEYASKPSSTTTLALNNALKKGLAWNQLLITGQALNLKMLAKQEHVTHRYVSRLIKMAFLSPDIMEAIIKGNIPPTLSVDRLREDVPFDWEEQRQKYGFTQ